MTRWVGIVVTCALATACHNAGQAGPPDQSGAFFPAAIDTYGLTVTQSDRDHLAELYAIRRIDPCGFVDQPALAANGYHDISYTYTAVHEILPDAGPWISPVGGDGCTIAFPFADTALELRVVPGESRGTDAQFEPDSTHPGVSIRTSSACASRVSLPLTKLAGAPASMRDPLIQVTPVNRVDEISEVGDTPLCPLTRTLSAEISARVRRDGIPTHSVESSPAARFFTGDPCAMAPMLHATGFEWEEPNPEAQWPTTWRHPSVCNIELPKSVDDPTAPSCIVRYGLADWSDNVVTSLSGEIAARSERDGVALFSFGSGGSSFVVAKSNITIPPTNVAAGASLTAPTPFVTVQPLGKTGADCTDVTALAALRRATTR